MSHLIENFVSAKTDPLHQRTVDFPFSEIDDRLTGAIPSDHEAGKYSESARFIRKFFLHVLDVDMEKPEAARRIGRRFISTIRAIQPDLLKGEYDASIK